MSYKVYPVIKTEPFCDDYSVKINGETVECNTARVSAVPFNRRWPGHQRQLDQTEPIQFVSLSTDEPIHFEITPNKPFSEVKIRPQSLGIKPKIKDGKISFTLDRPAYFTVEAWGRNRALHIFADEPKDYGIKQDENTLYFGAGEHDAGLIELKSNQTLYIDEGAVVYATVTATDAENVKILGRGILDNSKNKEEILFEINAEGNDSAVGNAKRAHTLTLEYCKNIVIDGITIRDSLVYNIRPIGCENITITDVKIIGCWRFNSDGIDMHNCKNVYISNCFIRTFDDSICVKGFDLYTADDVAAAVREATYHGGKVYDTFSDVIIEKCVIWNDWGKALEIGAETKAEEIYDVTFRNCDIIHVTYSALDCMNVDYADVHDITFRDINIEADEVIPKWRLQTSDEDRYVNTDESFMPITICAEVVKHFEYSRGGIERRGKNRDILFENINVISDKLPVLTFKGYDAEHKTENITVKNLMHNGKLITDLPRENFEIGDFCENIQLVTDPYSGMKKNDVDAAGQLARGGPVRFENLGGGGKRIMLVGNSMTLHGPNTKIGWYGDWGMAASSKEKDYVHLLKAKILERDAGAEFCICHVSEWERGYKNGEEKLAAFRAARDFGADVIVLRFVENVPTADLEPEKYIEALKGLIDYLGGDGKAKLISTTGFWRHPLDEYTEAFAKDMGIPLIKLGDLGDTEEMMAIGRFWHHGVSIHPGDVGMANIAERIWQVLDSSEYLG